MNVAYPHHPLRPSLPSAHKLCRKWADLIWSALQANSWSALGYLQANSYSKSLKSYHNSVTTCRLKFSILNRAKFQISCEFLGFLKTHVFANDRPRRRGPLQECENQAREERRWWYDATSEKRDDMIMLTLLMMHHACLLALFIILIRERLKAFLELKSIIYLYVHFSVLTYNSKDYSSEVCNCCDRVAHTHFATCKRLHTTNKSLHPLWCSWVSTNLLLFCFIKLES